MSTTLRIADISGFPGYRVGDDGSVWTCWSVRGVSGAKGFERFMSERWGRLKLERVRKGYRRIMLCRNGERVRRQVHHLVLEAFVGPCPPGLQARHLNNDPSDNSLNNLAWGTQEQNCADKATHGTLPFGTKTYNAKINDDGVVDIIADYNRGTPIRAIARRVGLHEKTVRTILAGKFWKRARPDIPRPLASTGGER